MRISSHNVALIALFFGLVAWCEWLALYAQSRPTFEVVSIKRNLGPPGGGGVQFLPSGRFQRINGTMKDLLTIAYPTTRGDIIGAPEWLQAERYDVQATAGREATRVEMLGMIQTMLEDRLRLRARVMTQEQPIWELVVARSDGRLGPDLKPYPYVCGQPEAPPCVVSASPQGIRAVGVPITRVISFITLSSGRAVFDRTGLAGNYEFKLIFRSPLARPPGSPPDDRPDVFTALQEQLGLKLVSARGPVDVLLVEHVERPIDD